MSDNVLLLRRFLSRFAVFVPITKPSLCLRSLGTPTVAGSSTLRLLLLPPGYEFDARIVPRAFDTGVNPSVWSTCTNLTDTLVHGDSHWSGVIVREPGDLLVSLDLPHEVGVWDRASIVTLLSELEFIIHCDEISKLVLDLFYVRVNAHASLQLVGACHDVYTLISAALDMIEDVRFDPVPVATACVRRGINREKILQKHVVLIGGGHHPGDTFKEREHCSDIPFFPVVIHHPEHWFVNLGLGFEEV